MALDLCCGGHGNEKKLDKFLVRAADKALCNIGHRRPCCTLNLTTETQVFPESVLICRIVYKLG